MILLTGATGKVGGATAAALIAAGEPFRVFVRDPNKLNPGISEHADVVQGDLSSSTDTMRALSDISRALLVVANSEQQASLENVFATACKDAGVSHLVKISSAEADPAATSPLPKLHYESEQFIKSLGIGWTMVQPNFFMQNFLLYAGAIQAAGMFALPFGSAKAAPIDTRDIGEVIAKVLSAPDTENQTLRLTGEQLMDFAEVAAVMSEVLGREIRYFDQPPDEFRAFMGKILHSEWHIDALCSLFAQIAGGALEETTSAVADMLGRPPRSLAEFVRDHQPAFEP